MRYWDAYTILEKDLKMSEHKKLVTCFNDHQVLCQQNVVINLTVLIAK